MTDIRGAVALVTGGNRGVGRAVVDELLARGAAKVYAGARTPAEADVPGAEIVQLDITELKEHQRRLEQLAHYDALTGIPNRVLLADRLKQAIAQTRRRKRLLALVYLDLDGFKAVNDAHGHEAGEEPGPLRLLQLLDDGVDPDAGDRRDDEVRGGAQQDQR